MSSTSRRSSTPASQSRSAQALPRGRRNGGRGLGSRLLIERDFLDPFDGSREALLHRCDGSPAQGCSDPADVQPDARRIDGPPRQIFNLGSALRRLEDQRNELFERIIDAGAKVENRFDSLALAGKHECLSDIIDEDIVAGERGRAENLDWLSPQS